MLGCSELNRAGRMRVLGALQSEDKLKKEDLRSEEMSPGIHPAVMHTVIVVCVC